MLSANPWATKGLAATRQSAADLLEASEARDENAAGSLIGMDDKDLTWVERMERDPSLAAFVAAEVGRAGVDAAASRAEAEHWRWACTLLRRQLDWVRAGGDCTSDQHRQEEFDL